MAIGYEAPKKLAPGRSMLSAKISIAKRRFEIENGRPPTGAEITALMKQSFQGVEEARMGKERVERAAETARNVSSQPWSSELDEKEEMRSPAYLKEQSQRRAEDRERER